MNDTTKFIIILALGWLAYNMYMSDTKKTVVASASGASGPAETAPFRNVEKFENATYPFANSALTADAVVAQPIEAPAGNTPAALDTMEMLPQSSVPVSAPQSVESVAGDKLSVADLLPADKNSLWAEVTPTTGSLEGVNLTEAGYHVGVNTIGQTLKNANYQIRSDPPVPKFNVGPFNNSTIEFDDNRRPFEIA
jgi:hypothetical protein